jgi:hypothetical protein
MNDALATAPRRYALSFIAGGLLTREAVLLAPVYVEHRDWKQVRDLGVQDNLLQTRTHTAAVRVVRETVQRLAALSDTEIDLLIEVTASERAFLMWAAACRRYEFIGEFAEEVVCERFLLLTPTLEYQDFDGFVRAKTLWHDELAELKESTLQRMRRNVFTMLREAELLSKGGEIMPAVLSERIAAVLSADLRFFPIRQGVGQ